MSQSSPLVCGIILNWNNYKDTSQCIESLRQLDYPNFEIIVVDNGSTDESGNRIRDEFDYVDVIFTGKNLGFGAGNNIGICEALERGADYLWVLNDDVLVQDSATLSNLVEVMEGHEELGITTPVVTKYPDTSEIWFKEGYIDWRSYNAGHMQSRRWFVDFRRTRTNKPIKNTLLYTDYAPFCSVLIKSEVFESLGPMYEDFFLYYSDVYFCARVREAGYKIATVTHTTISHKVSASSESNRTPTHLYYLTRNRILFKNQFEDRISPVFLVFILWWVLLNIVDQTLNRNPSNIVAIITGLLDGLRKKKGRGPYP